MDLVYKYNQNKSYISQLMDIYGKTTKLPKEINACLGDSCGKWSLLSKKHEERAVLLF